MSELHVDQVMKCYKGRSVLSDIYISCKKGEIVGLLGRNGSGKSTLLQIIFGSIPAEDKFVKVGNKLINTIFDARKLINYLPQVDFLPQHVKVKKLIQLYCTKEHAQIVMEHELIRPLLHKKSNQLSGGEKRLVEIWLILYSPAEIILLDEPFNGIAPLIKDFIKDEIKKLQAHKGFIITDHDYRNVLDVSTRNVLIFDGGTKEIKEKKDLIKWGYIADV